MDMVRIPLLIPEPLWQRIQALALEREVSPLRWIRQALEEAASRAEIDSDRDAVA